MLAILYLRSSFRSAVVPAGFAAVDQFVLTIFAWAFIGLANAYCGLSWSGS